MATESRHDGAVSDSVVQRYRAARRDRGLAVLEGFHALKHALRFGAELIEAVASDPEGLDRLAADLAPDLAGSLAERTRRSSAERAGRAGSSRAAHRGGRDRPSPGRRPRRGARRQRPAPVVLLEDPRTMGNMGACVRVAAAADAAARPDHRQQRPLAPRGAARRGRPALRPAGGPRSTRCPRATGRWSRSTPRASGWAEGELDPRSILAFGTERYGLSEALLERADARLAIPMREGVSSLNLATAVSAVLFSQSL